MSNSLPEELVKPNRNKWRPGLRVYLVLMNLVLLCLLFPTISIFFFHEITSFRDSQLDRTIYNLRQSLEDRGDSLAQSLTLSAGQAIAGYNFTFLNNLMGQVVENDPEILYALVMDKDRRVIAHNQVSVISTLADDEMAKQAVSLISKGGRGRTDLVATDFNYIEGSLFVDDKEISILEVVMPVHSGLEMVGVLRCGFSLEGLYTEIEQVKQEWAGKMRKFRTFFLSLTGVFFLVGLLVAVFFNRFFVRSTMVLSEGVRKVGRGDLTHQIPIDLMFCHEFDSFASGFNEMTHQLRISLNQLDDYSRSLEQKVLDRTKELHEAQAELLQQAHEAGMAEMAVGVLHNIGNAITPAKVDAILLGRRLRDSAIRTGLVSAASQMLKGLDHPEELMPSEKGRLMSIIKLLPDSIREEYDNAIADIDKICAKHEHIEGIISLQMRYARLIGKYEEVDVNLVVEDALRMLGESIERRSIELIKTLGDIPMVRIEQAKIIQIVINLIKNGYEALDEVDLLQERRIEIATSFVQEGSAQVVLSVKDTGVGFTQEEKEKMFRFGYTTKKTGSGFGLHSCANFMMANKGSLAAKSAGKGKGAEFVVKIPVGDLPERSEFKAKA